MFGLQLHLRRSLSHSSPRRIFFSKNPYPKFQRSAWIVRQVSTRSTTGTMSGSSDTSSSSNDDGVFVTPTNIKYVESRGDYQQDTRTGNFLLVEDSSLPLYQHQASLPRLPVPCIEDSIQKLIPSALPLAETNDEAEKFLHACRNFGQQARKLQEQLQQRKVETEADEAIHASTFCIQFDPTWLQRTRRGRLAKLYDLASLSSILWFAVHERAMLMIVERQGQGIWRRLC